MSYSCSCHHHLHHILCSKNTGQPRFTWKNGEREREREREREKFMTPQHIKLAVAVISNNLYSSPPAVIITTTNFSFCFIRPCFKVTTAHMVHGVSQSRTCRNLSEHISTDWMPFRSPTNSIKVLKATCIICMHHCMPNQPVCCPIHSNTRLLHQSEL